MIFEFCSENFTLIPVAISNGANRIELCDNLSVGGTTVSNGVLIETIKYCSIYNVPVMCIIRPRGGDFFYLDTELRIMQQDAQFAVSCGVSGVVIGALKKQSSGEIWLDEEPLTMIINSVIESNKQIQITFHMAFDELTIENQFRAINWLSTHKVSRILTHGGPLGTTIDSNIPHLRNLIHYAKDKNIIILPGGGITHMNRDSIIDKLRINELHGTRITKLT